MLKIDFTEKAIDEVYRQFMEHPSGPIKKKLHVVYLKAHGLAVRKLNVLLVPAQIVWRISWKNILRVV